MTDKLFLAISREKLAPDYPSDGYPGWVVLHVPHDSECIPDAVWDQFILDDDELRHEIARMTDHRTFDLFSAKEAGERAVRAEVSRLVLDVERFADDQQEPMAARGMGVIYTRTSQCTSLRRSITKGERADLLQRHYHPHHARITAAVEETLARYHGCLVLDCHSFPSRPLPYEVDQESRRPDICIGTDEFHSSTKIEDAFVWAFKGAGFQVGVNSPFAGALVPLKHYRTDKRVAAIMVEVNRRLYLDETTGQPLGSFEQTAYLVTLCC